VPAKATNKVDLVEPLRKFIEKTFSPDVVEQHLPALMQLNQQREDLRTTQNKNEYTRDLYLRYLGLLESLDKRFPINDDNIRIQYTWFDAFKNTKSTQYNLQYERACSLFNLGSITSHVAVSQNRSTPDGAKKSCHFFQLAAGTFEHLKDYLQQRPHQASTPDLTTELLVMLVGLMLAQAQECFCEKAAKDGMSANVITMLAAQTAEYYNGTHNAMISSGLKNHLDKSWSRETKIKAFYFEAMANYYASIGLHAKDLYGEEVARLQIAVSHIGDDFVKANIRKTPAEFQEWFNKLSETITKAFLVAEKENDSIYHERVPKPMELAKLASKSMVKVLPIVDLTLKGDNDPFNSLLPFEILQSVSVYNERKASLLREELKLIQEHNDFAKGSLGSMNLPAAIERIEERAGVPVPLQKKMSIIREEGGASLLFGLLLSLQNLGKEDENIIKEAVQYLDDEEQEDNEARKQFGDKWIRPHSHALTGNLRQEAAKYKSNVEQATKSDTYIAQKLGEIEHDLNILAGDVRELQSRLPSGNEPSEATLDAIASLQKALGRLDACIAERSSLEVELKALVASDDISSLLLGTHTSHESIQQDQIRKYESLQRKLRTNFEQQNQLLDIISNENAKFVASKSNNTQSKKRDEILEQLSKSFVTYSELKGNIREGTEFYTNFKEILNAFRTRCRDFAYARKSEKSDVLRQLQSSITGIGAPQTQSRSPYAPQYTIPGAWQPHMPVLYQSQAQPPASQSSFSPFPSQPPPAGYTYYTGFGDKG